MKVVYPSVFDPDKSIEVWFCDEPCCNGKELHRSDGGPAVLYPDGSKEWWLHGKQVTEREALVHNGELVAKAVREGRSRPVEGPERADFGPIAFKKVRGPDGKDQSKE